jgi:hypothetical protein
MTEEGLLRANKNHCVFLDKHKHTNAHTHTTHTFVVVEPLEGTVPRPVYSQHNCGSERMHVVPVAACAGGKGFPRAVAVEPAPPAACVCECACGKQAGAPCEAR